MSVGRVATPSRRSVPGVLPVRVDVMSMMSSESWNTEPICSPNSRSDSTISAEASETMAPKTAAAEMSEAVLSDTTCR